MDSNINDFPRVTSVTDFTFNVLLVDLILYTIPEMRLFSTKIQDGGRGHVEFNLK